MHFNRKALAGSLCAAAIVTVTATAAHAATINGTSGNNTLNGTSSADTINGYGGNDRIYGNGGGDTLKGGANADVIYGNAGKDHLYGNGGNDTLYVSGYDEDSDAGYGDDTVYYQTSYTYHYGIVCGPGTDTLILQGTGLKPLYWSGCERVIRQS